MSHLPATMTFGDTEIAIIDHQGRPWLAAADLAKALGYRRLDFVTQIYKRHADEFKDDMTQVIDLAPRNKPTVAENNELRDNEGTSPTSIRIFSPRGCHLVAMLARTDRAKAFRRWVLDVLEGLDRPRARPEASPPLPEDSAFVAVRAEGRWHYLFHLPNNQGFGTTLLLALGPALDHLGVNWTVARAVWLSRPCAFGQRWGIHGVGDPLAREIEPGGGGTVSTIPLHELPAFARHVTPNPSCAHSAARLVTAILKGWNAHLLDLDTPPTLAHRRYRMAALPGGQASEGNDP